jgi:DNA repair exonuclease SbcCD ATPase subunit
LQQRGNRAFHPDDGSPYARTAYDHLFPRMRLRAEKAEAELTAIVGLHATTLAECDEVKAELAEAQAHIDGLEGEPTKALAMKWKARAEQAEAELATVREEAEKWRSAASVLCGAHIGVPQATCPVCELATLRGALEAIRASVVVPLMTSEAKRLRNAVVNEIDAALTATPPHRTPEGER